MAILECGKGLKTIFSSKNEFLGSKQVATDEKHFYSLKMAISVNQNGHFEEMRAF